MAKEMRRARDICSKYALASIMLAFPHQRLEGGIRAARAVPAIAFSGPLLLAVFLACFVPFPLFSEEQKAEPGEKADTPHAITVVYPVVMPPYTFEDAAGEAQGLAVDLLRLWSKKTGVSVQFKSAPWEEGLQAMREGKADAHASVYHSEEREAYLDYAAIVAPSEGRIFCHKSILNVNKPGDLKGFKVGVVRGGYHERYLQEHLPDVLLGSYAEFPDMLAAAQRGDIRVFVDDAGATMHRLKERGLSDEFRSSSGPPLYRNNFWIAVKEGNGKLANAIKEGVALVTPGERATLERKWLPASLIKVTDTVFIAICSDNAPFSFVNAEGKPSGLLADIWRRWAEETGKKVEFLPSNWDDAVSNVKFGSADIHSGLFRSEAGAEWFDYSDPLCGSSSSLFFLHRDRQGLADRDRDLAGKKIGVLGGSYHEHFLRREHPEVQVIPFSNREKMVRAVVSGDTSACLAEDKGTGLLLSRLGLSGMFDAEPLMPFSQTIYAAVPKGQAQLLALVNGGFRAIPQSELASIQQRWGMGPEKDRHQRLVRWLLLIAGSALVLVCVFVLWNRSLRRMVKARTATLTESEERFRATFEQAAVGIAHISTEGCFLRINKRFCDMLGYSREEMLQRTFQDITHPDDLALDLQRIGQVLAGEIDAYCIEKRYVCKNGALVWVNLTVALVRDTSGRPNWFVSVVQDITEQKHAGREAERLRQELMVASRAASMGELSAALAHQLNQPLTAILSNSEAALQSYKSGTTDPAEMKEILTDIATDTERAGEVIRHLRGFMSKGHESQAPLDLNEIVSQVIELLSSDLVFRGAQVDLRLEPGLPAVVGDRVQVEQVLLNLALNGLDAMSDVPQSERNLVIQTGNDGPDRIKVTIRDRGCGIPPDGMGNLFKHFFTTKPSGMGMGLPIARRIVERHGGRLWAENNLDRGASFFFTLPVQGAAKT